MQHIPMILFPCILLWWDILNLFIWLFICIMYWFIILHIYFNVIIIHSCLWLFIQMIHYSTWLLECNSNAIIYVAYHMHPQWFIILHCCYDATLLEAYTWLSYASLIIHYSTSLLRCITNIDHTYICRHIRLYTIRKL